MPIFLKTNEENNSIPLFSLSLLKILMNAFLSFMCRNDSGQDGFKEVKEKERMRKAIKGWRNAPSMLF